MTGNVVTCLNGEVVYIYSLLASVSCANLPSCPPVVFSLFSSSTCYESKCLLGSVAVPCSLVVLIQREPSGKYVGKQVSSHPEIP